MKQIQKMNRFILLGMTCILFSACAKINFSETKDINKTKNKNQIQSQANQRSETKGDLSEEDEEKNDSKELQDKFSLYLSLLMLTLDDTDKWLEEEAVKNEDESFDYVKHGIRVWLDRGYISQVLILDSDLNINGASVGDDLQQFIDVFGKPSFDDNGEAHFSYECKFLVVQYDIKTKKTIAVYLLSEDYGKGGEDYLQ